MILQVLCFPGVRRRHTVKTRSLILQAPAFFATIGGRYVYIYSGFSYDKTGPLKPADTSVIFNYFGKEIPVNITVTARKATKLSVLAAPAKTQFTVGNTLDLSGVKLQITYNDGTQTPIFKADELEKYGVHVAFGKNGSFYNGCSR